MLMKNKQQQPIRKTSLQLPFAELRLPGNFTNIYSMPRRRRTQLLEIARKYELT